MAVGKARQERGWRQEDLASAAGYSRSTISRLETGDRAGTDIGMIRAVAGKAGVPPAFLGAVLGIPGTPAITVAPTATSGEDPVRRRQLLALGGAAIAGQAVAGSVGSELLAALASTGPSDTQPWSSARLAAAYRHAADSFAGCRYGDTASSLTTLISAAQASSTAGTGNARDFAAGIAARSYALCSQLGVKAGDDPAAHAAADRAFTPRRHRPRPRTRRAHQHARSRRRDALQHDHRHRIRDQRPTHSGTLPGRFARPARSALAPCPHASASPATGSTSREPGAGKAATTRL